MMQSTNTKVYCMLRLKYYKILLFAMLDNKIKSMWTKNLKVQNMKIDEWHAKGHIY
jgi:hypothetical protein